MTVKLVCKMCSESPLLMNVCGHQMCVIRNDLSEFDLDRNMRRSPPPSPGYVSESDIFDPNEPYPKRRMIYERSDESIPLVEKKAPEDVKIISRKNKTFYVLPPRRMSSPVFPIVSTLNMN